MSKELVHVGTDAFDRSDKNSFYNMVDKNSNLIPRMEELLPEIEKGYSEGEFKEKFGHDKNYSLLRRLRLQFWNLYNEACGKPNPNIQVGRIYGGITSTGNFWKILKDDLYATFLFTQPTKVTLIQQDLLYEGYKHLEEILNAPIKKKDDSIDNALVGHKIKIIQMMEDRINGSIVQRTQSYSEEVKRTEGGTPSNEDEFKKLQAEVDKLRKDMGKEEPTDFIEVK